MPNRLRTGVGARVRQTLTGDGHCEEPPALNVRVEPFGPDQARIDQSVRALLVAPVIDSAVFV